MDELSKNSEACAEAVRLERDLRHSSVVKCAPFATYEAQQLADLLDLVQSLRAKKAND